jgi:hypothetical protein
MLEFANDLLDPLGATLINTSTATLKTETLADNEATEEAAATAVKFCPGQAPTRRRRSDRKSSTGMGWKRGRPDRTMARFAMLFSMTKTPTRRSMRAILGAAPLDVLD